MSNIHYFQRYSSQENTVTNNTLLLFARISAYSSTKISQLLATLTGEAVEVGIEIKQQERSGKSIPDGAILQRSFKIAIESKVDAKTDVEQLRRHAKNLSKGQEYQKILLLLTKKSIGRDEEKRIKKICNQQPKGKIFKRQRSIIFKSVTYENICREVEQLFKDHEYDMRDLVEDYVAYCNETKLFDQSPFLMRIVPCGQSGELNRKHGIYFAPSDRGYTPHQFVGIYNNKNVQTIWKIDNIFKVDYDGKTCHKTLVQEKDSNDYDKKIVKVIGEAKELCGYDIAHGCHFFCGKPEKTEYRKSSPGGSQGSRCVNLQDVIGDFKDASDVAQKLKGKAWE